MGRKENIPDRLKRLEAELDRDREAQRRRVSSSPRRPLDMAAGTKLWNLLKFIVFAIAFGVAVILALNLLFWAAGIALILGLAWIVYHLVFGDK